MNLNSKFYKKIFLRKLEYFTYKSLVLPDCFLEKIRSIKFLETSYDFDC
ncbi:hypothetical protein LEP1GSC127_2868 [Leptospira kirschneri str. 200801925]|nr:hypothetical protein LEP1GSC127_2868 [Leptospira kirschneri str. 200801925]